MNHIDVSNIIDMSKLFCQSEFNGDISLWNIYNVLDMEGMFKHSKLSEDLNNWTPYKLEYSLGFLERMIYYPCLNGLN